MKRLIACFFLFNLCSFTFGADLCVTVSGSGLQDGSDWNNALSASFTPVRGNTYYLADGDYGINKSWNVAESGTDVITIRKATVSSHGPEAGWVDTMGDERAVFGRWSVSTGYWVFDGQEGGGPGDWDFSSDKGFYLYETAYNSDVVSISSGVSNVEFRRIVLASDRSAPADSAPVPVRGFDASSGTTSEIMISHCAIVDVFGPCVYTGSASNWTIQYTYIANNRSTGLDHSELHTGSSLSTNMVWRWNVFHNISGTAFFAGINSGRADSWELYGNVFYNGTTPLYYYWNATDFSYFENSKVYNNTFVDIGPVSMGAFRVEGSSEGSVSRNNLFYACDANEFAFSFPTDTHVFASDNIRSSNNNQDKDGEIVTAHTDGQNSSGDPFVNYIIGDPINSDFAAETPAGYDTSVELPGNNYDMFGNLRGADGVWDRGAIEFSAGASSPLRIHRGRSGGALMTILP